MAGTGKNTEFAKSPMANWLQLQQNNGDGDGDGEYTARFAEHHIGNPVIRSLHGGFVGSLIEATAELELVRRLRDHDIELVSSSIDYLRVTRDDDLHAHVRIVRIARRLAFVDVWCWQDTKDMPVARGSCTLRISDNKAQVSNTG